MEITEEQILIDKFADLLLNYPKDSIYLPINEIDGIKIEYFCLNFNYGIVNNYYKIQFNCYDKFVGHKDVSYQGSNNSVAINDLFCLKKANIVAALKMIFNMKYCKVLDAFLFCNTEHENCKCNSKTETEIFQTFHELCKNKKNIKLDCDDCIVCYELCKTKTLCCEKNMCRTCADKIINNKCPNCRKSPDDDDSDDE